MKQRIIHAGLLLGIQTIVSAQILTECYERPDQESYTNAIANIAWCSCAIRERSLDIIPEDAVKLLLWSLRLKNHTERILHEFCNSRVANGNAITNAGEEYTECVINGVTNVVEPLSWTTSTLLMECNLPDDYFDKWSQDDFKSNTYSCVLLKSIFNKLSLRKCDIDFNQNGAIRVIGHSYNLYYNCICSETGSRWDGLARNCSEGTNALTLSSWQIYTNEITARNMADWTFMSDVKATACHAVRSEDYEVIEHVLGYTLTGTLNINRSDLYETAYFSYIEPESYCFTNDGCFIHRGDNLAIRCRVRPFYAFYGGSYRNRNNYYPNDCSITTEVVGVNDVTANSCAAAGDLSYASSTCEYGELYKNDANGYYTNLVIQNVNPNARYELTTDAYGAVDSWSDTILYGNSQLQWFDSLYLPPFTWSSIIQSITLQEVGNTYSCMATDSYYSEAWSDCCGCCEPHIITTRSGNYACSASRTDYYAHNFHSAMLWDGFYIIDLSGEEGYQYK